MTTLGLIALGAYLILDMYNDYRYRKIIGDLEFRLETLETVTGHILIDIDALDDDLDESDSDN